MSRGTVVGLPVAQPLVRQLPSMYQDDSFTQQFTAGLDDVLAVAVTSLDCLHAYVDPALAPADFVAWLGEWVGSRLDEDWPLDRRREFVAQAAEMFAHRGTASGLREEIEMYTGGTAVVNDPGAVWTSRLPTDDEQRIERRSEDRTVRVTVDVPDSATVNWPALQVLIRDAVPAHLPVEIELREVELREVELGEDEAAEKSPNRSKRKPKGHAPQPGEAP